MSYEEYNLWQIYFSLEPFGWGALNALLFNINRGDGDAVSQDELAEKRLNAILEAQRQLFGIEYESEEDRVRAIREAIKRDMGVK